MQFCYMLGTVLALGNITVNKSFDSQKILVLEFKLKQRFCRFFFFNPQELLFKQNLKWKSSIETQVGNGVTVAEGRMQGPRALPGPLFLPFLYSLADRHTWMPAQKPSSFLLSLQAEPPSSFDGEDTSYFLSHHPLFCVQSFVTRSRPREYQKQILAGFGRKMFPHSKREENQLSHCSFASGCVRFYVWSHHWHVTTMKGGIVLH